MRKIWNILKRGIAVFIAVLYLVVVLFILLLIGAATAPTRSREHRDF